MSQLCNERSGEGIQHVEKIVRCSLVIITKTKKKRKIKFQWTTQLIQNIRIFTSERTKKRNEQK
jgi:hypothetical protein